MAGKRDSVTRNNIIRKRKQRARRRRQILFRLTLFLLFTGALLVGIVYAGYQAVSWSTRAYQQAQADYQAYTERQEREIGPLNPQFQGYTNILVMGIDNGVSATGEPQADSVLLLSFENDSGRVRFINIPRDTWSVIPDDGMQMRLSQVYAVGGAPMMVRTVNDMLGVSVHQYVDVDMDTFAELIDALGGIDIYVEKDMDYEDPEAGLAIHLKQGYQQLTGEQAEEYVRYRSEDLGDVGRVQRQQRFVKAVYQKLLQMDTLPKVPMIAAIIREKVNTSAAIYDAAHLANILRKLSSEPPESVILPGHTAPDDLTIWVLDDNKVQETISEMFPEAQSASGGEEGESN